jgi:RecB family exonuclease
MSERPLNPVDQPVRLSPSTLESISTCPLRWFLQTQAKAGENSSTAAPIGRLVHALADAVQRNEIPPEPAAVQAWLDRAWPALHIAVPWYSTAQRVQIHAALDRLCRYLRVQAAPEVFSDRLERGADGSWNVIDFKTSKTKPTQADVDANLQLGLYQAAILSGALESEGDPELSTTGRTADVPVVSGASLVQLTFDTRSTDASPKVQAQAAITEQVDPSWLMDGIVNAVHTIRTEEISARPGKHCRTCSFTMMCPAKIDPEVLADDD